MNNATLTYSNWATNNNEPNLINSNGMNCACLKLKDGLWKNCDCSLNQHFVCRKTVHRNLNMNIIISKFYLLLQKKIPLNYHRALV
jgi:hypothetical protein